MTLKTGVMMQLYFLSNKCSLSEHKKINKKNLTDPKLSNGNVYIKCYNKIILQQSKKKKMLFSQFNSATYLNCINGIELCASHFTFVKQNFTCYIYYTNYINNITGQGTSISRILCMGLDGESKRLHQA